MRVAQPATLLDAIFPARPGHVSVIRRAVTDAATEFGADAIAQRHIGLAVSEAASNAILHAYRDRAAADWNVRVLVQKADGYLNVSVRDNGIGMTPRPDSPGQGLGLCLMAHEAESVEIRSVAGAGTEVVLRFQIGQPS
jgi:serine/threonine-protein kinase RsbW